MYEVAWQASAALVTSADAATGRSARRQRRHTAQVASANGSQRSMVGYGTADRSTAAFSKDELLQLAAVEWMPASAFRGSRKQQGRVSSTVSAADPGSVTQGLELLQRLLAAAPQAASSVQLATSGALPAATSSCNIAGGAPGQLAAAAPAWGLARVAALEYADCRWQGVDALQYAAQPAEVKKTQHCIRTRTRTRILRGLHRVNCTQPLLQCSCHRQHPEDGLDRI